jgi:RNA polymerase sigma-70 factor (ECF subfamily)
LQDVLFVAYLRKVEMTDGWLCETARKLAANYRRLYRHEYEALDPGAIDEAIVEPMEPELRESVRRAFAKLDPADAELLVRRVIDGVSVAELARKLGVSKSGVRVRLANARKRLAEGLG